MIFGGEQPTFHCSVENLMIWPKGDSPDCILSVDNCYSITFRNIRIHNTQPDIHRAAVVLMGDAREGDVVLLAGKGHENYQIIGDERKHFDDLEEARRVLALKYTVRTSSVVANVNESGGRTSSFAATLKTKTPADEDIRPPVKPTMK